MAVNIWLASLSQLHRQGALHPGDWRQHVGHRIAPQLVTPGHRVERTEGPPQSGEEDCNLADRLSVLHRLTAPEMGAQRRRGHALFRGQRLQREESPDCGRPTRKRRTNQAVPRVIPLSGAGKLRHLTVAGRDTVQVHASAASCRVIFDSRQESSNESFDRTLRRWSGYCCHVGNETDPLLALLSDNERDLFLSAFLGFYRQAEWDADGKPAGRCRAPVVVSTLRKTASNLAASFRSHIGAPAPQRICERAPLQSSLAQSRRQR